MRNDDNLIIRPREFEAGDMEKDMKIRKLSLNSTQLLMLKALEKYPTALEEVKEGILDTDNPYIVYDGKKHYINYYSLGAHPEEAQLLIDCVYGDATKEQLVELTRMLDLQTVIVDHVFKNWLYKKAIKISPDKETCKAAYFNISHLSSKSNELLADFYDYYIGCLKFGMREIDLAPSPEFRYYGSALQGNVDSQKHIANYLQERTTPFSDYYWTKKAAEGGDLSSQVFLAHAYLMSKHPDEALPWLTMAAKNGSTWALYNEGKLLLQNNDFGGMASVEKAGEAMYTDAVDYLIQWHRQFHHPKQLAYWVGKGRMLGVATAFEE